jgi:MFS family permease
MYEPETQHWPLCFIVLSSTIGTSIGGVIGGPIEKYLTWQWNFWIQLIFGVTVQAVHFFMPESRSTILIDREAKRRRETGEDPNVYGPNELKKPRISLKEAGKIWLRPFEMFVREPIVLFLSLLSGFSDALIFTFLEAFSVTFPNNFGFGTLQVAWAFIPINASYFFTYFLYWPWFWRDDHLRKKNGPDWMSPERRLKPLLLLALFEPIGLFGFAWTCKLTTLSFLQLHLIQHRHGTAPNALDSTNDLLIPRRTRKLRNLLLLCRLHDCRLRSLLSFRYRW